MGNKKPRALVFLAEGAEEMELVIVVDVLRRAGVDVVVAGVSGAEPALCSRGVRVVPDIALDDVEGMFDAVVLPGGKGGASQLAASPAVGHWLRSQASAGRTVAAICAAPIALRAHGVFPGRRMTCHPSVDEIVAAHGILTEGAVVVDGVLMTSQGPGTAFPFALALVERLCGRAVADEVRAPMMFPREEKR